MSKATSQLLLERLRVAIAQAVGISVAASEDAALARLLRGRAKARALDEESYVRSLEVPAVARDELRMLARSLTVGETYFFRNRAHFEVLGELVLKPRAGQRERPLRLLSAACSSGEEAYSLAMLVREQPASSGLEVSIHALDLNPDSLALAAAGRYSAWSLRELPEETQKRWFKKVGREFQLDASIMSAVTFEERNLTRDDPARWEVDTYDAIFCRNVLMYFTTEQAQAVVARLARALTPGGYLFLGHAETLRGLSHDFELCHTHGTFYYQRKDGSARADPAYAPRTLAATGREPPEYAEAWPAVVERASSRIAELTRARVPAERPVLLRSQASRPELVSALALMREERYDDALALIGSLTEDVRREPDLLLVRATLSVHRGTLDAAEHVCRELLAQDEQHAGAHYVLALCSEGRGDLTESRERLESASHLDPGFAMPRLSLGLMARRRGDTERARRELGQALVLLAHEQELRLMLFGGGFRRDALSALCRAELTAAGGAP